MQHSKIDLSGIPVRHVSLVFGFVRNFETQCKMYLPIDDVLTKMVLAFYYYGVCWDVCADRFNYWIKGNGMTVERDNSICTTDKANFACSDGWNKGVHRFNILINKASCDAIGIISKIDSIKTGKFGWVQSDTGDHYLYVLWGGGGVLTGPSGVYDDRFKNRWKENDVISVVLDCDAWTVKFLINDVLVKDVYKIKPNQTYHAMMSTQTGPLKYTFVDDDYCSRSDHLNVD